MNKKILILDDDEDILDIVSFLLRENGYKVQTLSNGETVFEAIKEFNPELLLMDVMLGGMDGRVICNADNLNIGFDRFFRTGGLRHGYTSRHGLGLFIASQKRPNQYKTIATQLILKIVTI